MSSIDLEERTTAPAGAEQRQRLILRRVWASLWRHLPMLAISAAVTAVAALLAVQVAGRSQLLTPLLLAGLSGPPLMGLQAVVQGALVDDDTDFQVYLRGLRSAALRGAGHALVPALSVVSLLAAADVYGRTGSAFMLISLGTATAATILSGVGFLALAPLVVARPELRGVRLWSTSWHLLGRWPVRFLAPAILAGLALWVAVSVSSTLVVLLPAPIALLGGAAYWCCAVELGADDVVVSDGSSERFA